MHGDVQQLLLEPDEPPGHQNLTTELIRHDLGAGSWVEVRRQWAIGSDAVFRALLDTVDWRAERRRMYDRVVDVPRLTRFYGRAEPLPHPALADLRAALNHHYAADEPDGLTTAGLCLYRDGNDSVAWHGDTIGRGATHDTVVAIVSFGAPRTLAFRPRSVGRGLRLVTGPGDLVVMGGACQRSHEHAVPKTARPVGPRISIQFRPDGVR